MSQILLYECLEVFVVHGVHKPPLTFLSHPKSLMRSGKQLVNIKSNIVKGELLSLLEIMITKYTVNFVLILSR